MTPDPNTTILLIGLDGSARAAFRDCLPDGFSLAAADSVEGMALLRGERGYELAMAVIDFANGASPALRAFNEARESFPDAVFVGLADTPETAPVERFQLDEWLYKPLTDSDVKAVIAEARRARLERMLHEERRRRFAAERRLKSEAAAAEESFRAREMFFSTMGHEIRTPLNAIIGSVNLLRDSPLSGEQREDLQVLDTAAGALLELVNDLLDISKIEAGKIELERADFGLRRLLENVRLTFARKAKQKGVALSVTVDPDLPEMLVGDPMRLGQVITNLVSNAVKFTEEGAVRIAAEPEDDPTPERVAVRFSVSDTGIGIPESKQEKIFESFSQANADTSRRYGGTGLGLAIVTNLVGLFGGEVDLESEPGEGSTFSFAVAFALSRKPASSDLHERSLKKRRKEYDLMGKRVLLVEDNAVNQQLAVKFLSKWKARVDLAEDGREAVRKAEAERYDAILMDLQLPEVDGYEATRRIRALEAERAEARVPIIALTASALGRDQSRLTANGFDDYIQKPFEPDALYAKLRHILEAVPPTRKLHVEPSAERPPDAKSAYDFEEMRALMSDDHGSYREVLKHARADVEELSAKLPGALEAGSFESARAIAHKLAPTLNVFKMGKLLDLVQRCRKALSGEGAAPEEAEKLVAETLEEARSCCQALQAEKDRLG